MIADQVGRPNLSEESVMVQSESLSHSHRGFSPVIFASKKFIEPFQRFSVLR